MYGYAFFQITIEGVRGQGETGDIAVDDTYLYRGNCRITPSNAQPPAVTTPTTTPSTTSRTQATTRHVHQGKDI